MLVQELGVDISNGRWNSFMVAYINMGRSMDGCVSCLVTVVKYILSKFHKYVLFLQMSSGTDLAIWEFGRYWTEALSGKPFAFFKSPLLFSGQVLCNPIC